MTTEQILEKQINKLWNARATMVTPTKAGPYVQAHCNEARLYVTMALQQLEYAHLAAEDGR